MDILGLSDEELKIFLEAGIPLRTYRAIYANSKTLAKKIKGFRINSAPLNIFVQASMTLIKKEKNSILIEFLSKFYEDYKKDIDNDEEEMISYGYPKSIAYTIAVFSNTNEKFLPIYFKLEGIEKEEQKRICDQAKMADLIDKISTRKAEKLLKENNDKLEKKFLDLTDLIKDEIKPIKSDVNTINDSFETLKNDISKNNDELNCIKQDYVCKDLLKNSLLANNKKYDQEIKKLISDSVDIDTIFSLKNEINELKKALKDGRENRKTETINVSKITNEEYDVVDDFLEDCVGDAIENFVYGDCYDVLREYLIEIIYSKKPVICSSRNSMKLANILSSIVTGGNFYVINVTRDVDDSQLIDEIDSIPNLFGNKVILIKNKLGVSEHGRLLEYIKSRPFTEKFILEIVFDKELLFMPSESLDCFHFFVYNLKEGCIEYKSAYKFDNDNRKPLRNSDYTNSLEAIGAKISNIEIMNVNFYGILAFSIIPFMAINQETNPSELVNKLLNQNLRQKCEAVINDSSISY